MPEKNSGLIFDLQDYAVKDGPGVRTLVFLKGCPLHCRWCSNPEGIHFYPELMHSRTRCRKCLNCVATCPVGAVETGAEGFPVFDRTKCRTCDSHPCASTCPHQAIRIAGRWITPHELYERVRVNSLLYRNSGGGVTLSGGEPLAQPAFVSAFLDECDHIGLPVGVETCGLFDWTAVEPLVERFDFVFFDLKCMNPAQHSEYCGVQPEKIRSNLKRMSERIRERITISVPVIPGVNDDDTQIRGVVELCRELGIRRIRFLPYHTLGSGKYEELGETYRMNPGLYVEPEHLERIVSIGRAAGLECGSE